MLAQESHHHHHGLTITLLVEFSMAVGCGGNDGTSHVAYGGLDEEDAPTQFSNFPWDNYTRELPPDQLQRSEQSGPVKRNPDRSQGDVGIYAASSAGLSLDPSRSSSSVEIARGASGDLAGLPARALGDGSLGTVAGMAASTGATLSGGGSLQPR